MYSSNKLAILKILQAILIGLIVVLVIHGGK